MKRKGKSRRRPTGSKSSEDVVRKAKAKVVAATETNNPFEFKLSREKHNVLNRREKHARGKPGAARSKALQKRKRTLLEEYRTRNKANEFIDKRLGECDANMSLEDKMMARFAAERKSHHEKGDIYNLNDEQELTHFGQSLAQIEKFEDPRSDDEEDEGKLGARFVKSAHFGGGILTKRGDGEDVGGERERSRQEMIDEMIAKSKQRKHERQSEKEAVDDMTEKVDAEWSSVRSLLTSFETSASTADAGSQKTVDDYDVVVRELKFDIRAKPTDRLKTPEEIAMDEKERLEKLEADRLLRMHGTRIDDEGGSLNRKTLSDHKSADDLDDDIVVASKRRYNRRAPHRTSDDGEASPNDDWSMHKKKVTIEDALPVDAQSSNDDDGGESDESEESEADSYADVLSDQDSNVEQDDEDDDEKEDEVKPVTDVEENRNFEELECDVTESTRKELPYTFAVPSTYEEFVDLIGGHSTADQMVILERMLKCNHPCLAEGNLSKLEMLLDVLLRWTDDLASADEQLLVTVDGLVPVLFDLVRFSPRNAARTILEAVLKRQARFRDFGKRPHSSDTSLSTVTLLKLVAILFPASDFSHEVVTPTLLFMGQILTQNAISSGRDVVVGLFVCNLFLECVALSKRFVPEAMNFLIGCFLSSLTVDDDDDRLPFVHPFKPGSDLLRVHADCRQLECVPLSLRWVQGEHDLDTDSFRMSALHLCLHLLRRFADLYVDLPTFAVTFRPIVDHHVRLTRSDALPDQIKEQVEGLVDFLKRPPDHSPPLLVTMVRERKKPKPMRLLDPLVEDDFDGRRRRRNGDAAVLEKQRFEHRYKREMKGAIREIRRDNRFLAGQQFDEQQQRDAERKRKLREIYQDLASQEGFCKTIERKKMMTTTKKMK